MKKKTKKKKQKKYFALSKKIPLTYLMIVWYKIENAVFISFKVYVLTLCQTKLNFVYNDCKEPKASLTYKTKFSEKSNRRKS